MSSLVQNGGEVNIHSTNRVLFFDVLNVVASFGVVAMHFNGLTHSYSDTFAWKQAFAVDCIFYWAVPVFFMLTGATLFNYRDRYDTKTYFKKRLARTFIPFIWWSCIALLWKIATGQISTPLNPVLIISLIINTDVIDIYWFFIPLFGIYLSIPLLSLLSCYKKQLLYSELVCIALVVCAPFFANILGITWNASLNLPVLGGYLIYVVIGYLLTNLDLIIEQRRLIYFMGLLGTLVRYISTLVCSVNQNELVETTWGYLNLPCFLESIAVFVFAKYFNWNLFFDSDRRQLTLKTLSSCSFGVYLIHMFIFWYGLLFTGLDGGRLIWRTVGPVVAYAICVIIVLTCKKLPVIRRLFP